VETLQADLAGKLYKPFDPHDPEGTIPAQLTKWLEDYRRALCLLDPYALNPNWEVVETAGKMRSVEIFLNFMIMDANMNVLWKNPDSVAPDQAGRMTRFWGDESWRAAA